MVIVGLSVLALLRRLPKLPTFMFCYSFLRTPVVCVVSDSNSQTVTSEAELAQLLTSTKPNSLVVLKFCASQCKASRAVEPKFEQTAAKFSEFGGETGVHFAKVDLKSNRQLFEKMGVQSIPHVQVCLPCANVLLYLHLLVQTTPEHVKSCAMPSVRSDHLAVISC